MRVVHAIFSFILIPAAFIFCWQLQATSIHAHLEIFDPKVQSLLATNPELKVLATGLKWAEAPVCLPENTILFSEVKANRIVKLRPGQEPETFIQPSGYRPPPASKAAANSKHQQFTGPEPGSSGMALDAKGRLTVAGHAGRTVWRLENLSPTVKVTGSAQSPTVEVTGSAQSPSVKVTGSAQSPSVKVTGFAQSPPVEVTVLARKYRGLPLNSPNDLVYGPSGSLYFTDPPYGLPMQSNKDPRHKQNVNGVYRIRFGTKGHLELDLVIDSLKAPNGLAFSPDQKTLYVSDSMEKKWFSFQVKPDGTLGSRQLLFDASHETLKGDPDGMKLDTQGNLYATGPGGVWIFSAEGKRLGRLRIPEITSNLAWCGPDRKTLILTASDKVYALKVKVPGFVP